MAETTFRITGMDCADCARMIERGVGQLDGVTECALNYGAATLRVQGATPREAVVARVRQLGYNVSDDAASAPSGAQTRGGVVGFIRFLLGRQDTRLALLGALLIVPGLLLDEFHLWPAAPRLLTAIPSLAALLLAGFPIVRSAWRAVTISHEININVLMTIAAIGAVIISAYTEAGLVMVLFAIGEALEGFTMERARDSVRQLLQVAPNQATVLRPCMDCHSHLGKDGYAGGACPFCGMEEMLVPISDLRIGETIIVKPGERIAMDGKITAGASSVNQAPITGESVPVDRVMSDRVFAGSINGEGALEVEVTGLAADNTLSRIISMVEKAQEKRAPAQRFVDQFARYYTPTVVAIAALVAVIPPVVFGAPFLNPDATTQGWLYRALELLVVACPCALVISTPVALISAISAAAQNGVLIKGGAYLEALSHVKAIALDKTGTLTVGKPDVVRVHSVNCLTCDQPTQACDNCDDLLALASAVERRSEHPLAKAVVGQAVRNGIGDRYPAAEAVTAMTGKGVTGSVNGHSVLIGSHVHFDTAVPHDSAQCAEVDRVANEGNTPLLVSVDDQYRGYIAVADTVRDSSRQALATLKTQGITTLVMLTGDNKASAAAIARDVGVTDVRANLLPENKVDAVQQLLDQYHYVAMVGDGVNDAPALATATVGVAMGGAGTAQAMETADIVLMADDLRKLPFATRLSHQAMQTIHFNIAFSITVKLVFFGLVLAGLSTMWLAVLADVGVSLLVTLNSMRLLVQSSVSRA